MVNGLLEATTRIPASEGLKPTGPYLIIQGLLPIVQLSVTLLLLAVAVWFAPPQMEDAAGQCRALETLVLRTQPAEGEAVARRVLQYAKDRHTGWPTGVGCAMVSSTGRPACAA